MLGWRFFSSDSDNVAKKKSNWGASVSVDGHSVAIQEWIRDNVVAQNIKDNLRYLVHMTMLVYMYTFVCA